MNLSRDPYEGCPEKVDFLSDSFDEYIPHYVSEKKEPRIVYERRTSSFSSYFYHVGTIKQKEIDLKNKFVFFFINHLRITSTYKS